MRSSPCCSALAALMVTVSCAPTTPTPYDGVRKSRAASPANCAAGWANFIIIDGQIKGAYYASVGALVEQAFRGRIGDDGTAFVYMLPQQEYANAQLILDITLKGDSFELRGAVECSHYAAFLGTRISKTVPRYECSR
jgi:hypothetical protein